MTEDRLISAFEMRQTLVTMTAKCAKGPIQDQMFEAVYAVDEQPTIEERKTGEWIEVDDDRISGKCSVCGWEAHLYEDDVVGMPYCPNCGAIMNGEEE